MRIAWGIALLWPALAFAQPDRAAALFEEGRTFSQQGDYANACDRFEKSYALDSGAGTELNLGDCHEHLGHLAEAWRRFDDAAKRFETAHDDRLKFARERRDAVEKKVGIVVVKLADPAVKVTINGREQTPSTEIREHVDPGSVEIHAGPATRTVQVAAGATVVVDIPPPTNSDMQRPEPTGERRHGRVILAYGLGGVGAVSGAIALGVALKANSDYNAQFDKGACMKTSGAPQCTTDGAQKQRDAISLSNVGTGLAVVAVVAIAAGAVVYVTAPRDGVVVAPTASAGAAGLVVAGSF